jgi:hypothetical protein
VKRGAVGVARQSQSDGNGEEVVTLLEERSASRGGGVREDLHLLDAFRRRRHCRGSGRCLPEQRARTASGCIPDHIAYGAQVKTP